MGKLGSSVALILLLGAAAWLVFGLSKKTAAEPRELIGRVLSDGEPVAGAVVRVRADSRSTTTDAAGCFRLKAGQARPRITASKEGFFIAGASASPRPFDIELKPLPAKDNADYCWIDPAPKAGDSQRCGNCHREIFDEWSRSGHARSATGRHFRNLYDGTDWHGQPAGWSLLKDHPDGAGVCASCHAPSLEPGDPARFDIRQIGGVAARGVHCDYCHKVAGVGDGDFGLSHGSFNLQLLRPAQGQLFFGPLDDVDRGEDAFSPLYRDSKYCASCHEGVVFGVPAYTTYSEWLESPAREKGQQCQTCHNRPTGRMTNVAPGHGGLERSAKQLGNHDFFAGSKEEMLRMSLHLSATVDSQADRRHLEITIQAQDVGHRVPTGFIDRHLILVAEAFDRNKQALAAISGPHLGMAAGERLVGQAGKLYGKRHQDKDEEGPLPFWQPARQLVDTRLHPERKDRLEFEFSPATTRLRIQLIYRPFWDKVSREKSWPTGDIIVVEKVLEAGPAGDFSQADQPGAK